MLFGIVELYCGKTGKKGFYNSQEIGLAKAVKKLGYDPVVFFPAVGQKDIREEQTEEGIRIVYVPAKAIGVHSLYDWNILLKYDIGIAQVGSDNQIFAPNVLSFCDRHQIPAYCYIGTLVSHSDNSLKKAVMNGMLQRNIHAYQRHKCFVKTPSVLQKLQEYGIRDIDIAPVGLDVSIIPEIPQTQQQLRQQIGLPRDRIILLYVGRLDEEKRPIEAIRLLNRLKDSAHLVMIGSGNLKEEIRKETAELGLEAQITRIEQIENTKVHRYYRACDYYVNFCDKEIFGMSILEAMWHGCTVLACHAPGPDYIIENGVSGFLVNDTSEMAALIQEKQRLPEDVIHQRITDNFTWEKTAKKMLDAVNKAN